MTIPINVLLVDDSEDDRYFFDRTLRKTGVSTRLFLAGDGDEAIEFLGSAAQSSDKASWPAVVFLDLKMPGRNGFDVLRWINRSTHGAVKVVVLSGSQEPADMHSASELGASGYLVKPMTVEKLKEILATVAV